MDGARFWGKVLLWVHLFVLCVWLYGFHNIRDGNEVPQWVGHLVIGSIVGIQFTWGYTVGLLAFSQTLAIDAAIAELGYRPPISLDAGLMKFAQWWQQHG